MRRHNVCDKAIQSNANLRVERLLLFNEAVGAF